MTIKNPAGPGFRLLLLGLLLIPAGFAFAQESSPGKKYSEVFQNGTNLYREARWLEAAAEFRNAQEIAGNTKDRAEALYWIIMAELAAADYGSALRDMDDLEKIAPGIGRSADIVYHRARAYYYLGYYEDALVLFKRYCDNTSDDAEFRRAAAFFWMGECLYSMGQLEKAEEFYNWIIYKYPGSPKYDVSSYRIDLIKQKKIEIELLTLLRWSHEESLRTSEDFQRRIRTYEQALNAYQRRIADLSRDSRLVDLENSNIDYQQRIVEAEEEIKQLKDNLSAFEDQKPTEEMIEKARRMRNDAQWELRTLESGGGSR